MNNNNTYYQQNNERLQYQAQNCYQLEYCKGKAKKNYENNKEREPEKTQTNIENYLMEEIDI